MAYKSSSYLELNWSLTKKLNPQESFEWIVVENTPRGAEDRLDERDQRFRVIQGEDAIARRLASSSYHHATGLNKILPMVQTHFVLILDPDFYIIRKNWVKTVLQYMQTYNLSFFGAPYHPKWFVKSRYFPCAQCLFIDLERVEKRELDFTPGYEEEWHHLKYPAYPYVQGRRAIGSSPDTGYLVIRKMKTFSPRSVECLQPVFKPESDLGVNRLRSFCYINNIIETFLPDSKCYIPKRRDYFTEVSFRDLGYYDCRREGWEEFIWSGGPFGFHLRNFATNPFRHSEKKHVCQKIRTALQSFLVNGNF